MKPIIKGVTFVAIATLSARGMSAQSDNSIAGWTALIVTPIGALTPIGPAAANDTAWHQLQFRYGRSQFDDGTNMHTFGLGVAFRGGPTRTAIEFGYGYDATCEGCNYTMLGVDLDVPLIQPPEDETPRLNVAVNPAAGIGDGAGLALAAALSVPVSVAFPVGDLRLVPFISPGVGYGHVWSGGDSAGAPRNMLAGGISLAQERWSFRLTISARKVFLDGAPTVYGLGLTIGG